jgi:FkbM family methyltransferase
LPSADGITATGRRRILTKGNLFARAASRLPWVRRQARKLSHRNALERLKALGFAPATIYDIGAYRAGWSRLAQEVFPQATFILFEANADNAAYLDASGHRHFTVALADADGDKTFFLRRSGDVTGASLYVENTTHYAGENLLTRTVTAARLDSLVRDNALPPADLIKIDVQGAELDVVAGGAQALAHAQALIAELSFVSYNKGAPLIADAMPALAQHGFRCIDICELHRAASGDAVQADFLFVKPPLFAKLSARAGVG